MKRKRLLKETKFQLEFLLQKMVNNFIFVTQLTHIIDTVLYQFKVFLSNISNKAPDLIAALLCSVFVKLNQHCCTH